MERDKKYWEQFCPEDLEIIKEKDPTQYALIMQRLKLKANKESTELKKSIMEFDDFI